MHTLARFCMTVLHTYCACCMLIYLCSLLAHPATLFLRLTYFAIDSIKTGLALTLVGIAASLLSRTLTSIYARVVSARIRNGWKQEEKNLLNSCAFTRRFVKHKTKQNYLNNTTRSLDFCIILINVNTYILISKLGAIRLLL